MRQVADGRRPSRSPSSSISRAARRVPPRTAPGGRRVGRTNVLQPAQLVDQLELLEHEADVAQADPREPSRASAR